MKRAATLLAFGAVAAGMIACEDDRATLGEPIAAYAYGFNLVPNATNTPLTSTVRFQYNRANARPESLTVVLRGFDSLPNSFYTLWVGDSTADATFKRAAGVATLVRTDTTFNEDGAAIPNPTTVALGTVSAVKFGSPREVVTFSITRAIAGLAAGDQMKTLLVTVEDDANATTPNLSRVAFFARRVEGTASGDTSRTNNLKMGTFVPGPQSLPADVFIPTIRGRGFFQGPMLVVNDSSLARPPIGYYYAMWAIKPPVGGTPGDTVFLGDQRSPFPRRDISHYDADIQLVDPLVVLDNPPSILAGSVRVSADTLGLPADFPWKDFTEIWVTLEAKGGIRGRMGVMRMANGFAPGVITLGQRQ